MRRIASHYLIDRGEILRNPIVEVDDNGRIVALDSWERLDNIPYAEFYGGALCAGFVNAHSHIELSYLRGAIAQGTGFGGFAAAIGRVRGGFSDEERTEALAAADARMWSEGTQAVADIVNDTTSFPMKNRSSIRYRTFAELFGLNSSAEQVAHFAKYPSTTITPHSTYSLQEEAFSAAAEAELLSIHFMESPDELALYRGEGSLAEWYGRMGWQCDFLHHKSPARRLVASLRAEQRLLLVHGCCITREDVELLAHHFLHPINWVVCPQSNRYISSLRPPVELLRDAGAKICVGTDSLASNTNLSILEELKLMADVPLSERIKWATINGAEALGMEDEIGSVEVGKRPGIVLIEGVVPRCYGQKNKAEELLDLDLTPAATSRRLI